MIFTIINFGFLFSIFVIFYKLNHLSKNLLIMLFFLLSSVFFLNNVIFNPGYFPDQEVYLNLVKSIRVLNFYFVSDGYTPMPNLSDRTFVASGFMALIPNIFVFEIIDLSLSQKFLYLSTLVYFYKKNCLNKYSFAILFFMPSIILYTGLALKESLLFSLVSLSFYNLLKNNFKTSLLILIILLVIKPLIFILVSWFSFLYLLWFYFKLSKKAKIVITSIILSLTLAIFLIFFNEFNEFLNLRRYSEAKANRNLDIPLDIDLKNFNSVFELIFFSFYNILFNPNVFNATNLFQFFQAAENIFIIIIIIFNTAYCYSINKYKTIFWSIFLILGFTMVGATVFNAGTLSRWKIEIYMYYVFYLNYSCLNQNQNQNQKK